jgi:omega-6 fatty acid desaturase (delta-12 desaturase)
VAAEAQAAPLPSNWKTAIAAFRGASTAKSSWQLHSTVLAILALASLAYVLLDVHWAWTIPVTTVLAGCLVRLFILHHDCGHGSFFRTQRANDVAGTIIGWFLLTPYQAWRHQHAIHHATSGDLARRGTGDIWTLTTKEYEEAGPWKRLAYRLTRNPFIMCFGGAVFVFVVMHRIPSSRVWGYRLRRAETLDIIVTNIMGATIWLGLFWMNPLLLWAVYLPAAMLAGAAGVGLFYVQHQFEEVYWQEHDRWQFEHGAVDGSSYLYLGGILGWFTASIGVHHIHHLAPNIPNYKLTDCAEAIPELSARTTRLTAWGALRTFALKLYDQDARELITMAEHRRRRA